MPAETSTPSLLGGTENLPDRLEPNRETKDLCMAPTPHHSRSPSVIPAPPSVIPEPPSVIPAKAAARGLDPRGDPEPRTPPARP